MKKYACIIMALASVFACSKQEQDLPDLGHGSITFEVGVENSISETATRADNYELPSELIPDVDDFALLITGDYVDLETNESVNYSKKFASLKEYHQNVPMLSAGDYKAVITYGDLDVEGVNNPCFKGEVIFEVIARKSSQENITAALINSAIRVNSTEWFDKYYPTSSFSITTGAGNTFEFIPNDKQFIFVQASKTLRLKGTATKTNNVDVEFGETQIGTTTARTLNTITIDAGEAGGVNIDISLNKELTEIEATEIELNPEA